MADGNAVNRSENGLGQSFQLSHGENATFEGDGLRGQFVYRDLGIRAATNGNFHAHVIKAVQSSPPKIGRHIHTGIDFQLVYILTGWMKFWYDGQGEVTVHAGDCVLQPPGIEHDVLEWSDDLELLEVTSPADFGTTQLDDD